jgi:hypothetical protein
VANRIKLAGTTSTSFQIGLQKVTLDTTQISSPYTLNLPSGTGTANQILKTDGSGNLSWLSLSTTTATASGGGSLSYNSSTGQFTFTPADVNAVPAATMEPMGHADKSQSTISFNDSTRVFTISPASTSYDVWVKGTKFVISTTRTVTLPNTTGLYFIYFDNTGTLQYETTYFDWPNQCPTAYVYWNSVTSKAPFVADERHGITLDWATHEYLHRTRGAAIANGFGASNYVIGGSSSLNTSMQIDIASGTFFDEDLRVDVVSTNTPTANTWEQDLTGPSQIPIFYLSGTGWVRDNPTSYPLKQGSSRPVYNLNTGGTWSTPDIDNNKFGVTFIIATNNINYPVMGVIGQSSHANQSDAEAINWSDLTLTGFPVVEFRPLYKVVFQTKTSFSNTPKAIIASLWDLRSFNSVVQAAASFVDANALSGTTLAPAVVNSSLTSVGTLTNLTVTNTITGSVSGNAATATKLATARNINDVSFDGSADITVNKIKDSSGYSMTINSDGTVTLPGGILDTGSVQATLSSSNYSVVRWKGTGGAGLDVLSQVQTASGSVRILLTKGILGGATTTKSFYFNSDGTITLADGTVQSTAWTGSSPTLTTPRAINGVNFDGSADITITAAAGTLTGTTLKSTVVSSSLTSVGTLTSLTSAGTVIFTDTTNSTNTTTGALQVRGGVGVNGNIYLSGGINSTGSIYSSGMNVTYAPVNPTGQAFQATGKDTLGGTGYFDFFKINNTTSGGTNGSKTMRLNSVGTLEILNNAYSATILSITDAGFVAINNATSVSGGVPTNNAIAMNNNSYIYDDGNYHLTTKAGSIWLNANDGSAVNINTQMPSGITGGGLNVQGAVKSYGAGGAATAFISSGSNLVSGVALQLDSGTAGNPANMAVRDTSTVSSTMYFDVSTGGSGHGTFRFRSSNSFTELMSLSNSQVAINKQTLFGGGSQGAYVTITGTNSYNLNGPYGYLIGGGAGSINSGGSTGTVGWSLQCMGRIQVNEVDATSDERLKDIQGTIPLDRALQFVRAVDGILYTWKPGFGDEGLKSGFGAQSVHKAGFDHMVAPIPNELVEGSTDADGFTSPDKFQLTLNYMEAIPYHHEVIKHLLDRIEQLETTVAELKSGKY